MYVDVGSFLNYENYAAVIADENIYVKYWARRNKLEYIYYKPNFKIFKEQAPLQRDKDMVDACDILIAFWNGVSKETKSVIDYAIDIKRKTQIYLVEERD